MRVFLHLELKPSDNLCIVTQRVSNHYFGALEDLKSWLRRVFEFLWLNNVNTIATDPPGLIVHQHPCNVALRVVCDHLLNREQEEFLLVLKPSFDHDVLLAFVFFEKEDSSRHLRIHKAETNAVHEGLPQKVSFDLEHFDWDYLLRWILQELLELCDDSSEFLADWKSFYEILAPIGEHVYETTHEEALE